MKRVVAYCRVSTDKDDQLNSLENQKAFFIEYINKNPDWKYVTMYTDDGVSGTNTKHRLGFNRMVNDSEAGCFDLIVTKEISRFARNTLDSIYYTRKLKALGVGVFFLNDNINTLDPDSELRLTIMSCIAQEESRKTSDRVKFGQKRQMQKGVVFGVSVFGYDLENGKLTVNEKQAEIVRLIFSLYLNEGMGTHQLCHALENRGILSPSGDVRWKNASILRMLKNEKYIGRLVQKKEITIDYLSHTKIKNDGREELVVIEDNHEPIVSRETFEAVQREIVKRRTTTMTKSRHSNRYIWSGKIECHYCHSKFKRKIQNGKSKNPSIVWQCSENNKYGSKKVNEQGLEVGCDCKAVYESMLSETLLSAIKTVSINREKIVKEIKQDLRAALEDKPDNSRYIASIKTNIGKLYDKKSRLRDLYTDESITRAEFDNSNEQYDKKIEQLNEDLAVITQEDAQVEDLQDRLNRIDSTIEQIISFDEISDEVCKQILHKIVVHSREKIDVYLAGGNNPDPFSFPFR